jgi:integrase
MAYFRKRTNKAGEVSWQATVRVKKDGVIIHQESETWSGRGAERFAKDWATKLEAKVKLNGVPQRALSTTTLGALLRKYRDTVAAVKPLRRAMEHEIEFLATSFDTWPLAGLASDTFSKWALRRRAGGTGPVTILHNLATVRSVLNAAKPMYGLDIDGSVVSEAIAALGRVGAVGKSEARTRRPSEAELLALDMEFRRIAPHPSTTIDMATFVRLAVALPRRRDELCSMKWVDWANGVITLRETKNPRMLRTEHVPVPPEAATIIDAIPRIDERILPYNPESVSASFQRACDRLGIKDLHLHDLRHEGISRLFERGLDIPEVAMISGHQSWNMLRRYTHLKPATVLEKMRTA